ncbi:MAG: ribosomal protection-like ABC-F family protein [Flavipsychrobacter sp.]
MLILRDISYIHTDKDQLFTGINLIVNDHEKIALVGNNGSGKSTLLKIIAGILQPSAGILSSSEVPYYVPQLVGQYNDLTVAQALGIDTKLQALKGILAGDVTEENMTLLDDDWTIEERSAEAMSYWKLEGLDLQQKMASLSGGQKTKVLLAGLTIHQPEIVLLDEPSNHLDTEGRELLYHYIQTTNSSLVVVSHDRVLLNMLNNVAELSTRGLTLYGGNYDFYAEQKAIEESALNENLRDREKALRKAKETEREMMERQQKLDARGKKKQEKAGVPTIALNTLRNNAEKSTAKAKDVHAEKIDSIAKEVGRLRKELPGADKMKIALDDSSLYKDKVLVTAEDINFRYAERSLWRTPLSFVITGDERMVIKGLNGSGKTTLIKILLGILQPTAGLIQRADINALYVDQDYSLIDNKLSVYEQAQQYNRDHMEEHEVKSRLNRFLFTKEYWAKPCSTLSGGEKMRLVLCCLTIGNKAPDMIVLDEPTNNLDIQNIEILTAAINEYKGCVIVVSHDTRFVEEIGVEEVMELYL